MRIPLEVGKVMRAALREFKLDKKAGDYEVILAWPEVVGEQVAEVTVAEALTRGILIVKVADSVWKYELSMRKREILHRLQRQFPDVVLKDIQWK